MSDWDPVRAWRFLRASKTDRAVWRLPQSGLPERHHPLTEQKRTKMFRPEVEKIWTATIARTFAKLRGCLLPIRYLARNHR